MYNIKNKQQTTELKSIIINIILMNGKSNN